MWKHARVMFFEMMNKLVKNYKDGKFDPLVESINQYNNHFGSNWIYIKMIDGTEIRVIHDIEKNELKYYTCK